MGSDTDIRPDVAPPALDGDHERLAHIVYPKEKILEAAVTGTPVFALCGKVWVPNRNPDQYAVCQGCIDMFEKALGRRWPGRR
jgi:Protein of unknown function (DUF3039)